MNRLFRSLIALLLSIGFLALFSTPTGAAVILVECLEWAIADADLVVRGTITDHDRVQDKEEVIWTTATFKVTDTIKGEKKDEIKFVAGHKSRFASDRIADFARNKTDVLLCLVKSDRYKAKGEDYAGQPWALRIGEGEIDQSSVDLTEPPGVYSISLTGRILIRKDDILKAAVAAGSAAAKMPAQGRLRAPSPAEVVKKLSDGGPVWLLVPINQRLEETGKEWLKAKEIEFRVDGVKALRHFKSDDNVTLMKGLLADAQSRTDGTTKTFPIRLAAYDVLKQWKVDVPRPVVEEPEK